MRACVVCACVGAGVCLCVWLHSGREKKPYTTLLNCVCVCVDVCVGGVWHRLFVYVVSVIVISFVLKRTAETPGKSNILRLDMQKTLGNPSS